MPTQSKYPIYRSKLDSFSHEIARKMQNYVQTDIETNQKRLKIVFLGVNQYQNGIPFFVNWDIIYLYRSFLEAGIEARLHDPHIRGSEGLSQGVWLGRHNEDDNWSHSFDVMILSCPHLFYIQNITKLGALFVPNKRGLLLDIWGAFTKIYKLGDSIDIVTMRDSAERSGMLGGMAPLISRKRLT